MLGFPCLYESSQNSTFINLSYGVAVDGCNRPSLCHTYAPLVSLSGFEIDDQGDYSCDKGPLTVCEYSNRHVVAESVTAALGLKLLRNITLMGINRTEGYWTGSNIYGEIDAGSYMDPYVHTRLLGDSKKGELTDVKKWLCVCFSFNF